MELLNRLTVRQLATGFPPPGEPDNKVGLNPPIAEVRVWEGGIVKDDKPDPKADPNAKPRWPRCRRPASCSGTRPRGTWCTPAGWSAT